MAMPGKEPGSGFIEGADASARVEDKRRMFSRIERRSDAESFGGIFDQHERKSVAELRDMAHAYLRHPKLIGDANNGLLRHAICAADQLLHHVRIGKAHGVKEAAPANRRIVTAEFAARKLAHAHHLQRVDIHQKSRHRQLFDEPRPQLLPPSASACARLTSA